MRWRIKTHDKREYTEDCLSTIYGWGDDKMYLFSCIESVEVGDFILLTSKDGNVLNYKVIARDKKERFGMSFWQHTLKPLSKWDAFRLKYFRKGGLDGKGSV